MAEKAMWKKRKCTEQASEQASKRERNKVGGEAGGKIIFFR
jgi:hypothetical protein